MENNNCNNNIMRNNQKNSNQNNINQNNTIVPEIKTTHYLSNNHLEPNKSGVNGRPVHPVRRRSSNLTAQICVEKGRRLSQISSHSLALALELKRTSVVSHKSLPDDHKVIDGSGDIEVAVQGQSGVEVMSFKWKCTYTCIMLLIHHNFGLSLSGFAPSFVDFTQLAQTTMTYIGLFPIFQAIGCISGSLCGTLYRWLPRQLVLLTVVTFMALGTIFMPYATQVWHLYICIFFYGFGIGAWNNSNNVWLMEMWQENSPSVLQFSQAIYGVGTILGPLVVKPYLTGTYFYPNSTLQTSTTINTPGELASSISEKLKTPFLIDGCIELIGPAAMLLLFFIKPYKYTSVTKIAEDEAATEEEKALIEERQRLIPKKTLIVCVSIFMAFGFMTENMYMDFAPTFFQYVPLTLSAPLAAEVASTMAIALAGGRGLCVFVAMKVRPQYMIMVHVCLIWLGVVIQYFGQNTLGVLWFSAVLICYGYSCIYVALFAFVNQYFELTDAIGTIFITCYNSLYLFLPYFIGDNIETMPDILMYLMFGCVSVAIVDFAFVLFRIRNIPKRLIRI